MDEELRGLWHYRGAGRAWKQEEVLVLRMKKEVVLGWIKIMGAGRGAEGVNEELKGGGSCWWCE